MNRILEQISASFPDDCSPAEREAMLTMLEQLLLVPDALGRIAAALESLVALCSG